MFGIHDYRLFVLTGVLLNLTPGQDTFYILGRSLGEGRGAGIASALGIGAGSVVHTLAAALGLSAILATSTTAFTAVKMAGAAYLVYLGARMLVSRAPLAGVAATAQPSAAGHAFRQGMWTNLLNPKVALFFLALMPQFIDSASTAKVAAFVTLGLTFTATGTIWCLTLALAASRFRGLFVSRPRAAGLVSRSAGALFVALGIRLATDRS
jgi:threonine/homoserine/homoserine lactone efflux protein